MDFIKATYEYTKIRKTFGQQPLFQAVPASMLDSITPKKKYQKDYMLRNPVHRFVQATSTQSEHEANTKQLVTHELGINHEEGGWPRDIQASNEDQVLRYRRRVIHDDNYIGAVLNLAPVMNHYVDQNNAIEMYQAYFSSMSPQEPVEKCSIRIANVFRDEFNRPVTCVAWTHETNSKLVAAYSHKINMPEIDNNTPTDCYIWDVSRQTEPIHTLKPDFSCWQLACSPVDPELLVAGLENGTVAVFDIREGVNCLLSSSVYNSHRGAITSLIYVHSRTHTEFLTGSPDGQCLLWDLRDLTSPLDCLPISIKLSYGQEPNLGNAEGVSSLSFDSSLPTRYLCGTESGIVINVNRIGREHSEKVWSQWDTHIGSVRAMQRSPCTSRMFLTCGDSSVRVWSEEVHTAPIIVTKPYRYPVMDASWAPLRYSSYMSVCAGGYFYYWDFLRKYKDPIITHQVAEHELTKITPHMEGHSVAIGDSHGDLHLIHLSDNMVDPGSRDKVLMSHVYTRETHREHILDNRLKEIRLKMKAEEEAAARTSLVPEESIDEEKQLEDAEAEYFRIVNDELSKMESITSSSMTLP